MTGIIANQMQPVYCGKKHSVKTYNSIRDEQVELTLFINY